MNEFEKISIYCDGSCSGNPGPGGWAAIFIRNEKIEKAISGFVADTTNNRMEISAAINAVKLIEDNMSVKIYTDSAYLKNGITDWINKWKITNWNNGKIKNVDLWKTLDSICSKQNIEWHWVRAHNGNKYNEMADKLAKEAISHQKDFFNHHFT